MIDTSGFYKFESEMLLCGENFVLNSEYELRREDIATLILPVDGWYWFDSIEQAREFFGIPEPVIEEAIDPLMFLTQGNTHGN